MRLLLLLIAFAGLTACTRLPAVDTIKTQYAVVHYQGPKKPFKVAIQKSRPANWVSIGSISPAAVKAIVISEDSAFYNHKGIDPNQIKEAIEEDLQEGRFARGASTITQQVVKNVFLSSEKTFTRKIREIILALKLEKVVPKRRILETYLNVAEWGEGVFGIGPAAQHYFGKPASELTAREGAFLAMLLPSPKRYSQSFRQKQLTPFARRTVNSILRKMAQVKFLSEEDLAFETARAFSWEKLDIPPSTDTSDEKEVEGEDDEHLHELLESTESTDA